MDSFLNLLPLYTHVSRRVISVSEISAVNFMVVLNQLMLEKRQENEISRPKIIHESRIPQTINHASHAFRYSRITFLFKVAQ